MVILIVQLIATGRALASVPMILRRFDAFIDRCPGGASESFGCLVGTGLEA